MGSQPYEIIVSPFEVYVAPVGESFPDSDAVPAGNWVKLGANGSENMDPAGVTVNHPQTIDLHRPYGTTAPVKATRSSEDLIFSFTLWDLRAVEYSRALDHNTVTATAAGSDTPGTDDINFYRGLEVSEKAWLIRSDAGSPAGGSWAMQYELPKGIVMNSPSIQFGKSAPAGLAFEIQALFQGSESSGEELGRLFIQTATAL